MEMKTWWLYVVATFLICGTPGPSMLHVAVQSSRYGARGTLPSIAGLLCAMLLYFLASAFGVGALFHASPRLFEALRYAGACYLIWLGIKSWRAAPAASARGDAPVPPRSGRALCASGFATGLSNSKLILFATAFLPQFIDRGRALAPQEAILIASFFVLELFWFAMYATGGRSLAAWLARPARRRLFDRGVGTLFVGFGAALIVARV